MSSNYFNRDEGIRLYHPTELHQHRAARRDTGTAIRHPSTLLKPGGPMFGFQPGKVL